MVEGARARDGEREGVDVDKAHDEGEDEKAGGAEEVADDAGRHREEGEEAGEDHGRADLEGVLQRSDRFVADGLGAHGEREGHADREEEGEPPGKGCAVGGADDPHQGENAQVHDGAAQQRGLEGRGTFLGGLLCDASGGHGDGGAGDDAAYEAGHPQARAAAELLDEEVAGESDGGDHDDDLPDARRIQVETRVAAVGEHRQHDAGDQEKLEDGEEFALLEKADALLDLLLFLEEDRAEDGQSHGDPHVGQKAEHARRGGEEDGQLGGPSAVAVARFGPVGDGTEAGDGEEGDGGRLHDSHPPQVGGGVAEQGGEGEGAHARAVQGIGAGTLAFESDEDSQGEGDDETQFLGPDDRLHDRYCNS